MHNETRSNVVDKVRSVIVIALAISLMMSSLRTIAADTSLCQTNISTLILQVQTLQGTVQWRLPDAQQDALLSPLLTIGNDLSSAQKGNFDQLIVAHHSIPAFKSTAAGLIGYNQGAFDADLKTWISTANQLSQSLNETYRVCTNP